MVVSNALLLCVYVLVWVEEIPIGGMAVSKSAHNSA